MCLHTCLRFYSIQYLAWLNLLDYILVQCLLSLSFTLTNLSTNQTIVGIYEKENVVFQTEIMSPGMKHCNTVDYVHCMTTTRKGNKITFTFASHTVLTGSNNVRMKNKNLCKLYLFLYTYIHAHFFLVLNYFLSIKIQNKVKV